MSSSDKTALNNKVDKVEGKGLSTDDFKVIELTDYLTQGAVLPTDDNLIYTYSGQVVEKKIGHNGGGDDIIAFATFRNVDAYDVNNITVIKYDKGDEDESYHFTGEYNLHNDSGVVVEELRSMFGVRTETTTTDGLMSTDDKSKLDGLFKTWSGTQAEYDNLSHKDSETIYLIKEE
jgi:hypothetical protein